MLTEEQVRHIAKLARLDLNPDEIKRFAKQLSEILGYVDLLNEVDTDGVVPTSQVTGLENVSEEDEVRAVVTREEMLGCAQLPVELNQIRVKAAISSD